MSGFFFYFFSYQRLLDAFAGSQYRPVGLCNVLYQIDDLVGITPLIIVPGNEFYKAVIKHDAGFLIKDACVEIAAKVGGDQFIVVILDDPLH